MIDQRQLLVTALIMIRRANQKGIYTWKLVACFCAVFVFCGSCANAESSAENGSSEKSLPKLHEKEEKFVKSNAQFVTI